MKPRFQMALFGFFFFFYMLTSSREIAWNDAHLIYHTAGSIVTRGELGVPSGGPGKVVYALHPIMAPLAHVPGWMIYNWVIARWMPAWSMAKAITTHVGPSLFGALTCALFFNAAMLLKVGRKTASIGTLLVGLGTTVWVYARSPYSEIVQAATFMGFIGSVLAFWHTPRRSTAFRVGLWAALAVNSKVLLVLSLPGGLLVCVYRLRKDLKRFLFLLPWALVPLAAGFWVVMLHNEARTGVATNTGYVAPTALFSQPLWEGTLGLLASPAKSVFVFAPPLLLSLFGLRACARSHPHVLVTLFCCSAPVFYVYAKYDAWSGDWAWGPRYMVPMMAPWLLPGLVWLASRRQDANVWLARRTKLIVVAVAASGLLVQILGAAFYWDHFIRIAQEARNGWLGTPNRSGAREPFRPGGGCGICFEDTYPFAWLPPFSQVQGHWWLLRTVPFKKPWTEATMTAPWARYTRLQVPLSDSYPRARVDWWPLEFSKRFKEPTYVLAAGLSFGLILCGVMWWRGARRTTGTSRTQC